jgi:hypothetical protein
VKNAWGMLIFICAAVAGPTHAEDAEFANRERALKIGETILKKSQPNAEPESRKLTIYDCGDKWCITYPLPPGLLGRSPIVYILKKDFSVVRGPQYR